MFDSNHRFASLISLTAPIAILLFVIASPQLSHAQIIDYTFEGIVCRVGFPITSEFSIGDLISGGFSVDSANPTVQPSRNIYDVSNLSGTIGASYPFSGSDGSLILRSDGFSVSFSGTNNVSGAPVNGNVPGYFDIQLDTGGIFSPGTLPNYVPLGLGEFDRSNINFPSDSERLSFKVTSIVQQVPEPTSLTFLILGCGVAGMRRIRPKV